MPAALGRSALLPGEDRIAELLREPDIGLGDVRGVLRRDHDAIAEVEDPFHAIEVDVGVDAAQARCDAFGSFLDGTAEYVWAAFERKTVMIARHCALVVGQAGQQLLQRVEVLRHCG